MGTLIKNATIINEGLSFKGSLLITNDRISKILDSSDDDYTIKLSAIEEMAEDLTVIDADNMLLLPGAIDDQVHFREPGATHKGDIASESAAAVLGGVTSFMDMPNNNPPACTIEAIEQKYAIASQCSPANYSFYLGASNENMEEILKLDPKINCGVKLFMGSSTGNMLVDNEEALEAIFRNSPTLIATHCEDEASVREALAKAKEKYADEIPIAEHPNIRTREACIKSTSKAIDMAIKSGAQLHILHTSTADEVEMVTKAKEKNPKISFELCVHYLWFCDEDYPEYGTHIKCNPAIKRRSDMVALRNAVAMGLPGAVATDHAPHLLTEKQGTYTQAPSGLPTVQHSLRMMLQLSKQGIFPIERVPQMMSHAPADTFRITERGYIREGYFADLVLVESNKKSEATLAYKCGWTPISEDSLDYGIVHTFVNGIQVVKEYKLTGSVAGRRMTFNR
jgi:dihydroorotase